MTEDVWLYPRPPVWQAVRQPLRVMFAGRIIAQTERGLRVLETSHPPVYYIPMDAFPAGVLVAAAGRSWCEWKGDASYWDVRVDGRTAEQAGWSYAYPTAAFAALRDHVALYAGKMEACFVGDEQVTPQPGGFYGGWVTRDLIGPFKGGPGSASW